VGSSSGRSSNVIGVAGGLPAPPADIFRARHERLREFLAERQLDALVLASLPNLTYISGFSGSAGLLIVTADRLYLLIDFRYSAAVARAAAGGALAPALDAVQIDGSYDRSLAKWLAERAFRRVGFEASHLSVARYETWRREVAAQHTASSITGAPAIEWVPVEGAVEDGRLRKDPYEIEVFRDAALRLSSVARDVLNEVVRAGRTESAIAADIDWRIRHAGFSKTAFDTIVAAGPNSALPHAVPTDRVLEPGDLVLLDFGGVYGGYCVDLTRTVGLGPVSDECKRLYTAVHDAHAAALQAAGRPGVTTGDVDAAARDTLGQYGLAEQFGHGTGHGLGLEIHEAPRISKRTAEHPGEAKIEPGMVFTIEPGAYVTGLGGVRIEDDVLVTPSGCTLLTDVSREWREL
jgi:Xaa-Pro aminopeptidase